MTRHAAYGYACSPRGCTLSAGESISKLRARSIGIEGFTDFPRIVRGRHVSGDARIAIGDVVIDLAAHRVQRNGADIHLTPIEYELLTTLARHRGKVMTHRQLLRDVWGAAHVESPHYLRIYMRALRNKIEPEPARPRYLLTEIGVGYRLVDEPVDARPDTGDATGGAA